MRGRRAQWHIEALDPPATRREDDSRSGPPASGAALDLGPRPGAHRSHSARERPTPSTSPTASPARPSGGRRATPPTPWAPTSSSEDEALVIEGRSPPCAFWNVCLWNQFLHTYDYAYERVTLNGDQAVYEPDGSWRLVVARRDPGHPNWVSTAGHCPGPDLVPLVPARGHPLATDDTGRSHRRRGVVLHPLTSDGPDRVVIDDLADPHWAVIGSGRR